MQKIHLLSDKIKQSKNPAISKMFITLKNVRLYNQNWFISFREILDCTLEWIKYLPKDIDVVVGIPRSGMFVASVIALSLGKPLTSPELFAEGKVWWTKKKESQHPIQLRKVLLVDDTIGEGTTFMNAQQIILEKNPNAEIIKASLFSNPTPSVQLDYYFTVLSKGYDRFEWGLMHAHVGITATDMDGILCEECPLDADRDEEKYKEWIATVKPYRIPAYEIDAIITSRLEKYRKHTEEWLRKHGVKYKRLIMWNLPDKKFRTNSAEYKSRELLKLKPEWYWESNFGEAKQIWKKTKIPVLCFDKMILLS